MQTNVTEKKEPGNPVVRAFASFIILTTIIWSIVSADQLGGILMVILSIPFIPIGILLAVNAIRRLHQQQNKTALEWVAYVVAYLSIIELLAYAAPIILPK